MKVSIVQKCVLSLSGFSFTWPDYCDLKRKYYVINSGKDLTHLIRKFVTLRYLLFVQWYLVQTVALRLSHMYVLNIRMHLECKKKRLSTLPTGCIQWINHAWILIQLQKKLLISATMWTKKQINNFYCLLLLFVFVT